MHVVHRGDSSSALPRAERPLDVHYTWNGDHSLDELLARTATTGFIVLKDGTIISERYFWDASSLAIPSVASEKSRFLSESMAKSFTSTLVGLAIADGKIDSVHRLITDYLPELKGSGYEHATIEDLLEMSSGVNLGRLDVFWKSTVDGDLRFNDFAQVLGSVELPGSKFVYDNIDTQVLGALVARVTGQSLSDYMSRKIWQPLGMEQDALWQTDRDGPHGMEAAFCCLNAALRDYARFGLMFANQGKWNGRQIVPAQWVAEATAPSWQQAQSGRCVRGDSLGFIPMVDAPG
jgi:CubicO group peptidase (beta-lactamase class C family)